MPIDNLNEANQLIKRLKKDNSKLKNEVFFLKSQVPNEKNSKESDTSKQSYYYSIEINHKMRGLESRIKELEEDLTRYKDKYGHTLVRKYA